MTLLHTVALLPILYVVFLTAFVVIDRATGWTIADAFGKTAPGKEQS
jgi:hypothetical protein